MRRNKSPGSSLGNLIAHEGCLGELETKSIKVVLSRQIEQAMREKKLTKTKMAEMMQTSRSQVYRVLDPQDHDVTLATLQRAATVVGRKVQLVLE